MTTRPTAEQFAGAIVSAVPDTPEAVPALITTMALIYPAQAVGLAISLRSGIAIGWILATTARALQKAGE